MFYTHFCDTFACVLSLKYIYLLLKLSMYLTFNFYIALLMIHTH